MCMGMELIGAVGSLAIGAAQMSAQEQQNQEKFAEEQKQYNENFKNSIAADTIQQNSLTTRQEQEAMAYSQKAHEQVIQGAQADARMSAAAASSGFTGTSTDALMAGVGRQIDDNLSVLQTNWNNTAQNLQNQKDAETVTTQGDIERVATPVKASDEGAELGFAGSALKSLGGITKGLGGFGNLSIDSFSTADVSSG